MIRVLIICMQYKGFSPMIELMIDYDNDCANDCGEDCAIFFGNDCGDQKIHYFTLCEITNNLLMQCFLVLSIAISSLPQVLAQ